MIIEWAGCATNLLEVEWENPPLLGAGEDRPRLFLWWLISSHQPDLRCFVYFSLDINNYPEHYHEYLDQHANRKHAYKSHTKETQNQENSWKAALRPVIVLYMKIPLSFEVPFKVFPKTPLRVWIHEPRKNKACWLLLCCQTRSWRKTYIGRGK